MFIDDREKTRRLSRWILVMVLLCSLIVLGIAHIGVVADAVGFLYGLIRPLVTGLIFAYIMNVPYSFFERHLFINTKKKKLRKMRRPVALMLSFVLLILAIAGIVALVIPELGKLGGFLVDTVEKAVIMIQEDQAGQVNFFSRFNIDWEQLQKTVTDWISDSSGKLLSGAAGLFGTAAGGVMDFVFAVIFAVYMLVGKDTLLRQMKRLMRAWLPEKAVNHTLHVGGVMNTAYHAFIVGQVTEAGILGSLCAMGMLILGLPNVLMISVLVGVCALIPIVGAWVSAIVGAFLILIVDPGKAAVFLIFLLILQQLEGNLIYPRVVGGKLHLPGIWVLAAVTIGGGIAGPFGMLMGVPLAAGLYSLLREWTKKREQKKQQSA